MIVLLDGVDNPPAPILGFASSDSSFGVSPGPGSAVEIVVNTAGNSGVAGMGTVIHYRLRPAAIPDVQFIDEPRYDPAAEFQATVAELLHSLRTDAFASFPADTLARAARVGERRAPTSEPNAADWIIRTADQLSRIPE